MNLTSEDIEHFDQQGFLIVEQILSLEQVAQVIESMARVYRGEFTLDRRPQHIRAAHKRVWPLGLPDSVQWFLNARVCDGDFWNVATSAEIGRVAATLLHSPSVSLVEDQLLNKPPQGGRPVKVHRDYSYWTFSKSSEMLTCWMSLVEASVEMGTLQVIPGSHKWEYVQTLQLNLMDGSEQGWLSAAEARCPAGTSIELVPVVVPPGGGVFFHSLTFHGSSRNTSNCVRRAISLHYASERCRFDVSRVADHLFPYTFAGLRDGGPLVNRWMPQVYPPRSSRTSTIEK